MNLTLESLLEEFTAGTPRYIDRDDGETEQVREIPLLELLEEAKTLRSGKSSGDGGSSMPVSGDPLIIEQDIIKTIHEQVGVHNRYTAASLPLGERLQFWARLVTTDTAIEWLSYWAGQIKALFHHSMELDVFCPNCGEGGGWELVDGVNTWRRAIRATYETKSATCWICHATWDGERELRELAASC